MKIYLRPVTLEDGPNLVKWRNSKHVLNHCFDKTPITLESNEIFYRTCIESGKYKQFIVERVDEDFGVASYSIATVYLKDIDRVNKRCELCIFTSDDQEWNTESQSIAIKRLIEMAFNEYDMHKLYTYVFSEYLDEIALMKQAGMAVEATLANEARTSDGKYCDVFRMMIIKDDYLNSNIYDVR